MTELIDEPDISFKDWSLCLKELNTINSLLGGHSITIQGIKKLIGTNNNRITVAEIGCGGGDNLKAIYNWNNGRYDIHYTGIDLNGPCIEFARTNCKHMSSDFIHSDYRTVQLEEKPDIIFSSLFCHHFTNDQLTEMLQWLKTNSKIGFFINDLQRHPLAFHSIKWLTRFFSSSYLVRHDAPVSVLRGFKRRDWEELFRTAGISQYSITWKWAFRYLVLSSND